jgi:trehalose synthase
VPLAALSVRRTYDEEPMGGLTLVPLKASDVEQFSTVLTADQMQRLRKDIARALRIVDGRVVWNVNSTAKGGGVAEMLGTLLPYARGLGVDARWLVIDGDDEFFRITKRIHNNLHGAEGDGGDLGQAENDHYASCLGREEAELSALVAGDDIAILHDPQTAGLIPSLKRRGVRVIWRCHVGLDMPNELAHRAWRFLIPYVSQADAFVFSRWAFAWEGLDEKRMYVIAPSIDPFSTKNYDMSATEVEEVLRAAHLADDTRSDGTIAEYVRRDGTRGRIEHHADIHEETRIGEATPLVVQISRWDRLKDPVGVLDGFAWHVLQQCEADLLIAGPSVSGVADDPEGTQVFDDVYQRWQQLPQPRRRRIHLASLPMIDEEENAAMVNALQRRAQVVVQKSLAEGFGLTVAEAMWKARPVVASRIGGIQDQIEDNISGVLLDDPNDLRVFGDAVCLLLGDPARATAIGEAARDRVREQFLAPRHLLQYVDVLASVLATPVTAQGA